MCIYCNTTKDYRKIYKEHFGPIPYDENGRIFDIHHKDGKRSNNNPENLIALSIQEHYDVHYSQHDWAECNAISMRMKLSPEEKSKVARLSALNRSKNGTHNFLGGEFATKLNNKRVKEKTHHFLGPENQKRIYERLCSQNKHNTQIESTCPHCGLTSKGPGMYTWHFDKCKFKKENLKV